MSRLWSNRGLSRFGFETSTVFETRKTKSAALKAALKHASL